ncbi:MAG: hypothetical protein KGR26_08605 [Cyanobacteria bacterium REEB65]|nr:hypothetical protein [Cyanobacteria bacterium REEB65]
MYRVENWDQLVERVIDDLEVLPRKGEAPGVVVLYLDGWLYASDFEAIDPAQDVRIYRKGEVGSDEIPEEELEGKKILALAVPFVQDDLREPFFVEIALDDNTHIFLGASDYVTPIRIS